MGKNRYNARKEYVDYQKSLKKYGEFGTSWKRYYWTIPGYQITPVYKDDGPYSNGIGLSNMK